MSTKPLKVKYCFAQESTVTKLRGLFSEVPAIRKTFRDHIQELEGLLQYDNFDLRFLPTTDFTSGLVSNSVGMLHFKDPNTLETIAVNLVTDKHLIEPQKRFQEVLKRAKRIDRQVLQDLIAKAREEYVLSSMATILHSRLKEGELTLEEMQLVSLTMRRISHLKRRITEEVEAFFDTHAARIGISIHRSTYIKKRILRPLIESSFDADIIDVDKTLGDTNALEKEYEIFINGIKKGEFSREAVDRYIAERHNYHIFFFEESGKVYYKDVKGNIQQVDMRGNILPQKLLAAFLERNFGEICDHGYLIRKVWGEKRGKSGIGPTSVDLHQLVRRLHKLTNYTLKNYITARKGGFWVKRWVRGCLIRRKSPV